MEPSILTYVVGAVLVAMKLVGLLCVAGLVGIIIGPPISWIIRRH